MSHRRAAYLGGHATRRGRNEEIRTRGVCTKAPSLHFNTPTGVFFEQYNYDDVNEILVAIAKKISHKEDGGITDSMGLSMNDDLEDEDNTKFGGCSVTKPLCTCRVLFFLHS